MMGRFGVIPQPDGVVDARDRRTLLGVYIPVPIPPSDALTLGPWSVSRYTRELIITELTPGVPWEVNVQASAIGVLDGNESWAKVVPQNDPPIVLPELMADQV